MSCRFSREVVNSVSHIGYEPRPCPIKLSKAKILFVTSLFFIFRIKFYQLSKPVIVTDDSDIMSLQYVKHIIAKQ